MSRTMKPITALIQISAACLLAAGAANAQYGASACGGLANAYGPYDYRVERTGKLPIVDGAHFTPQVEFLIKGDRGPLGADLDYTLRASPNHHRALASVANWGVRTKGAQPPTLPRPVECYFDRAFRFQPDDTVPRLLFANYLNRLQRFAEAKTSLQVLSNRDDLQGITHFNIGMLLLDAGAPEEALRHAHLALSKGWPRSELADRLRAVGKWQEPEAATEPATGASSP
jgi:hypothetical protein